MALRRLTQSGSWGFDFFVLSLCVLTLASLAMLVQPQSDTWWLLRAGETIVEQGTIPLVDSYSWTVPGVYWPNHEWLTEVLMYCAYALGGLKLVTLVFAVCIFGTWSGVYTLCDGAPRWRCAILGVGIAAASMGWALRPQIISLALFVLVLHLIFTRRWRWLPPVMLLWANMHAGVVAGCIVLAIATILYGLNSKRDGREMLVVSSISGVLTLINPLGISLWLYVSRSVTDDTRRLIQEWQAPSLGDPMSYPFILLCALTGFTAWHFRRTWSSPRDRTLLIGSLVFAVLAWKSVRHTAFFELMAWPLVSRWCSHTRTRTEVSARVGRLHQVFTAVAVVIAVSAVVLRMLWWRPGLSQPLIQAITGCAPRLFNSYDIGGELIWFTRSSPVFIDNRQDPYPHSLVAESMLVEQSGKYHELFERYEIRCAVIPESSGLAHALRNDGWKLKTHDGGLTVWELSP